MKKIEYIWISNLDISNENKLRLIKAAGGISALYNSSLEEIFELGVNDEIAYKILDKKTKEKSVKDLEYIERNKIDVIEIGNKYYPKKFLKLVDMPVCFYIKGNKEILNSQTIGIVGSRLALNESLEISRLVANAFAIKGINVISGLAKGIDKYAHLGALDSKGQGKTIGVLACGLDKKSFYPSENFKVYERIVKEGGAVISEYPIGQKPKPYYFPLRNRLISGLSDEVFVVQASNLKSGSMITVDYALEQGKEVYVYKSRNINNPYFEGNRLLIEEGAKILKI